LLKIRNSLNIITREELLNIEMLKRETREMTDRTEDILGVAVISMPETDQFLEEDAEVLINAEFYYYRRRYEGNWLQGLCE
jgi:hypothetical protein